MRSPPGCLARDRPTPPRGAAPLAPPWRTPTLYVVDGVCCAQWTRMPREASLPSPPTQSLPRARLRRGRWGATSTRGPYRRLVAHWERLPGRWCPYPHPRCSPSARRPLEIVLRTSSRRRDWEVVSRPGRGSRSPAPVVAPRTGAVPAARCCTAASPASARSDRCLRRAAGQGERGGRGV